MSQGGDWINQAIGQCQVVPSVKWMQCVQVRGKKWCCKKDGGWWRSRYPWSQLACEIRPSTYEIWYTGRCQLYTHRVVCRPHWQCSHSPGPSCLCIPSCSPWARFGHPSYKRGIWCLLSRMKCNIMLKVTKFVGEVDVPNLSLGVVRFPPGLPGTLLCWYKGRYWLAAHRHMHICAWICATCSGKSHGRGGLTCLTWAMKVVVKQASEVL